MLKTKSLLGTALVAWSLPFAAHAQMAVIDNSNLARAIETARNTLTLIDREEQQISEQQKLYAAGNRQTDIPMIAQDLNSEWLLRGVPADVQNVVDLASANLSDLGSIGQRAQELLAQHDYSTQYGLAEIGNVALAARDQAIAENGLVVADRTAEGLAQLKERLRYAETDKETSDLQARATLEVAQLINQANQRAALQDAQNAALRLQNLEAMSRNARIEEDAFKSGQFMPTIEP